MLSRLTLLLAVLLAAAVFAPAAAAAKRKPDPVLRTLSEMAAHRSATPEQLRAWRADWRTLRSASRRGRGSGRVNLAGVQANTVSLAKRKLLAARAPVAFATVRHNLEWFSEQRRAAPPAGTRVQFGGTELVWQLYSGSGWQLQPLGSFGHLNGLLSRKSRKHDARIRAMADALLSAGVNRRGYLAFEYLFPWGGGPSGWVSGMAQATGMQALAGAGVRLADPRYTAAAERMRGAFERPAPWGVRARTGKRRAHFLLYSQSPKLWVGNGFAQALLGLDRYRELTGDPAAARLVAEGLRQAERNFPRYDTGAWSLYHRTPTGPGRESDLHYHRLFAEFLGKMCARFARPAFCRMREHFAQYEAEPVKITGLRAHRRGGHIIVDLRVSKRGPVTVSVWTGARRRQTVTRHLLRGPERFELTRPGRAALEVRVQAVSLTGVVSHAARNLPRQPRRR